MSNSKFNGNQTNRTVNNRYFTNDGYIRSPSRNFVNRNHNNYSNQYTNIARNFQNHLNYTYANKNNYPRNVNANNRFVKSNPNSSACIPVKSPEKLNVRQNNYYTAPSIAPVNVETPQVPTELNVIKTDDSKDSNNNENGKTIDTQIDVDASKDAVKDANISDPTILKEAQPTNTTTNAYHRPSYSTKGNFRGARGAGGGRRWNPRPRVPEQFNQQNCDYVAYNCSICSDPSFHVHYQIPQYYQYPQFIHNGQPNLCNEDGNYSLPPTPSTTPSDVSETYIQNSQLHRRSSSVPPNNEDTHEEIKPQTIQPFLPEVPAFTYGPPYQHLPWPLIPQGQSNCDVMGSFVPANLAPNVNDAAPFTPVYFYDPYQANVNPNGVPFWFSYGGYPPANVFDMNHQNAVHPSCESFLNNFISN